jgi:hypothetical protein
MRLLWEWWLQIWPNLAASAVVWLPAFVWHHRRIKAHVTKTINEAMKP